MNTDSPDSKVGAPKRWDYVKEVRLRHLDWVKYLQEFDTVDLNRQLRSPLSPWPSPTMTAETSVPGAGTSPDRPEDFDYVITYDDGFEAINASPRLHHDSLTHSPTTRSSFSDMDAQSEGGETVETVSVCGQSDAATIASVGSDMTGSQYSLSDSLRFPDPTSPLLGRSQVLSGEPDLTASLVGDLEPPKVDDQDWSAVRDSEITIKGSDGQQTPVDAQAGTPPAFEAPSVLPTSKPTSDVRLFAAKPIWRFCTGVLIILLCCYAPMFGILPSFGLYPACEKPSSGMNSSPRDIARTQREMGRRHHALSEVLSAKGFVNSNGSAFTPQEVLVYPVVNEGHLDQLHISSPMQISIVADRDQLFISLPKNPRTREYPSQPQVEIIDPVCDLKKQDACRVNITKQEDLIKGLTYVLLGLPEHPHPFSVHVSSSGHTASIPIEVATDSHSLLTDALEGAKMAGGLLSEKMQIVVDEARDAGAVMGRYRRRISSDAALNANKIWTMLRPKLHAMDEGAQQALRTSAARMQNFVCIEKRSQLWSSVNTRLNKTGKRFQKVQDRARKATSTLSGKVYANFSKLRANLPKKLQRMQTGGVKAGSRLVSKAHTTYLMFHNTSTTILSRAQRNGIGISRRVVQETYTLRKWLVDLL